METTSEKERTAHKFLSTIVTFVKCLVIYLDERHYTMGAQLDCIYSWFVKVAYDNSTFSLFFGGPSCINHSLLTT